MRALLTTLKSNKGFTLVELIVAITVSAIISVSVVILFSTSLSQSKRIRVEGQLQIEEQTVMQTIVPILKGANAYETQDTDDLKTIIVQTRYKYDFKTVDELGNITYNPIDGYYYICIDKATNRVYFAFTPDKYNNIQDSVVKDINYLGQFVRNISITPQDKNLDDPDNKDYIISVHCTLSCDGVTKQSEEKITLRNH